MSNKLIDLSDNDLKLDTDSFSELKDLQTIEDLDLVDAEASDSEDEIDNDDSDPIAAEELGQ